MLTDPLESWDDVEGALLVRRTAYILTFREAVLLAPGDAFGSDVILALVSAIRHRTKEFRVLPRAFQVVLVPRLHAGDDWRLARFVHGCGGRRGLLRDRRLTRYRSHEANIYSCRRKECAPAAEKPRIVVDANVRLVPFPCAAFFDAVERHVVAGALPAERTASKGRFSGTDG